MNKPAETSSIPESHGPQRTNLLSAVPLSVRMVVYGISFLLFILAGVPWLAYRFDVYLPAWRVDLGVIGAVVGWTIFGVFLAIYLYCSYVLTSRGKGAYVEFDPPTAFVASGPYRWVRNPVAACIVVMLLGEAIALSSTGIFLLFVLSILLAHLQVVLLEEPLLRQRFGQSYEDYLSRVPRWLPRRPRSSTA